MNAPMPTRILMVVIDTRGIKSATKQAGGLAIVDSREASPYAWLPMYKYREQF